MFLKDHLKEEYLDAYLNNRNYIIEQLINKWAHRFGVESLNELIIKDKIKENCDEGVKEAEKSLEINEDFEYKQETHQKCLNLKDLELTNPEQSEIKPNLSQNSKEDNLNVEKLPLPSINNLRKWIKSEKKAS